MDKNYRTRNLISGKSGSSSVPDVAATANLDAVSWAE
jgi:hypothetical protein